MPRLPFARRGPADDRFVDGRPQMRDAPPAMNQPPPLPGTPAPVAPGSAYLAAGIDPKPVTTLSRTAEVRMDVRTGEKQQTQQCPHCHGHRQVIKDLREELAALRRENAQLRYGGTPGGVSRKPTE